MSVRSYEERRQLLCARKFGAAKLSIPMTARVRAYLIALEHVKVVGASWSVTGYSKTRLLVEAVERLKQTAGCITNEDLTKCRILLANKMEVAAKALRCPLPRDFREKLVARPRKVCIGVCSGRDFCGRAVDNDQSALQRKAFEEVNAKLIDIVIKGPPEFVNMMRHTGTRITFATDDGSDTEVVTVKPKRQKKNLKLGKCVIRFCCDLWEEERRHPEHYPDCKGRKVSKADVHGSHDKLLAQKGVVSYEDFVKAIDNGRKLKD